MTRSRPTASRRAISGGMSCIVEQLGLAMIPSCHARSSGLTCDTTSGTVGSIRHALELSITAAPRAAAAGASSFEVPPPALNSAMSTPSNASGVASSTSISRPSTVSVRPADRSDAIRRSRAVGSCFSSRTWIIVRPTAPVAPTTAMVSVSGEVPGMVRPAVNGLSGTARSIAARPFGTRRVRPAGASVGSRSSPRRQRSASGLRFAPSSARRARAGQSRSARRGPPPRRWQAPSGGDPAAVDRRRSPSSGGCRHLVHARTPRRTRRKPTRTSPRR